MIRLCGLLALLTACGRFGFEARPAHTGDADAAPDSTRAPDAMTAADAPAADAPMLDAPFAPLDPCDEPTATLYVAAGGSGTGDSPADPMGTISQALAAVPPPPVIHVAAGTYSEALTISKDVLLCGGWDPTFATRSPRANRTILTTSSGETIEISNVTSAALVDGFLIENTSTSGGSSAGIAVDGGSPTIARNWIQAGADPGGSRAIAVYGGNPIVRNDDLLASDTGGGSWGLDCLASTADPIVANDTIVGHTTAIRLGEGCTPRLANDLLVMIGSGIWELDGMSAPRSIEDVAFASDGGSTLLTGPSSTLTTTAQIDALQGTAVPSGGTMRAHDAILASAEAKDLFVSFTGPDGLVDTLAGNDWRLGAPANLDAGKDTSASDCGTNEAPESCGDVRDDIDGQPRAAPYTIGSSQR